MVSLDPSPGQWVLLGTNARSQRRGNKDEFDYARDTSCQDSQGRPGEYLVKIWTTSKSEPSALEGTF